MTPEEIRQLADEIVARQEFQRPEPSLLEQARGELEDLLGRIVEAAFSGSAGSIVGWVVIGAAVAAVIWFATRVGRTVDVAGRVGVTVEDVHRQSPTEWRAEAESFEARGQWKEALRCRYRALVGDLVAEGLLDDVAGRTTGEYRTEVTERDPARGTAFTEATDLFELAWYGDRPTGPEENARFRDLAAAVTAVRA